MNVGELRKSLEGREDSQEIQIKTLTNYEIVFIEPKIDEVAKEEPKAE